MPYRRQGSPYWWISYTNHEGDRTRESSGTTSRKEAKELESKHRLETHRVRKWGEQPSRSFDELLAGYLEETAEKSSHDRDLDSCRRLMEHFAGKPASPSAEDVGAYRRWRKQARPGLMENGQPFKPASDGTIAKELFLYSAAIRHANSEWAWDLKNTISGRAPTQKLGAPKWLTPEEVQRLKAGVRRSPHLLDFIELGLATGMRCEEMLGLEWRRVDFGARLVWFDSDDQKSGIPGSIPLNNGAIAVLRRRETYRKEHCEESPWVFCTAEGARLGAIKKTFARAAWRAKLKASPHTLRHTFASRLVQAGVPLRTVKDLCRHADIRTTMRYAFLAPENTREAIMVLDCDRFVPESGHNVAYTGTPRHKTVTRGT